MTPLRTRPASSTRTDVNRDTHGGQRSLSLTWNSISIMSGKAATMGLGFAFWVAAARQFEPVAVGLAAGAVSAMMLCTQLAILGTGSAVISEFPSHARDPRRLLDTAITLVIVTAFVAAGLFLLVASTAFAELRVVGSDGLFASLFVAMCLLGTLGILFDQVSITLGRGDQMLVRGLLFGAATVVLVVVLPPLTGGENAVVIFAPWVAAGLLACTVAVVQLRRSRGYVYRPRLAGGLATGLLRVGLPNYGLTLAERAPGLILPLIVIEVLSPAANAVWYVVWMMAWVVFMIPISAGLALFAEGSHRPDGLPHATSRAVRAALALGLATAGALAFAAPWVLSVVGTGYAATGTTPLRILVWTLVPLVFVQMYFATCRARRRLGEAIATGVMSGVVAVAAAAAAGAVWGLNGMAGAWVVVYAVAGAWSILRLRRVTRIAGQPSAANSPSLLARLQPRPRG